MYARVVILVLSTFLVLPAVADAQADDRPSPESMAQVVESIEFLDRLRSTLAESLLESDEEVDEETFGRVCRPVGQQAARLSRENPWTVGQMAVRYRNPGHQADDQARTIHRLMEDRPDLQAVWVHSQREGSRGYRYFRRITVEQSCLACHGAREERPEFVRERYPEDRAFGFEAGDLRGVYSVFVPLEAEPD